jgi:hypothetical protein
MLSGDKARPDAGLFFIQCAPARAGEHCTANRHAFREQIAAAESTSDLVDTLAGESTEDDGVQTTGSTRRRTDGSHIEDAQRTPAAVGSRGSGSWVGLAGVGASLPAPC